MPSRTVPPCHHKMATNISRYIGEKKEAEGSLFCIDRENVTTIKKKKMYKSRAARDKISNKVKLLLLLILYKTTRLDWVVRLGLMAVKW